MPTLDTLPLNEARANSATGQRRGAAAGIYRVHLDPSPRTGGEAGARRRRDDPGDPAQACRGGRSTGEGAAGPPFRQRRLLLDAGDPASRQASQEPGRVVPIASQTLPATYSLNRE